MVKAYSTIDEIERHRASCIFDGSVIYVVLGCSMNHRIRQSRTINVHRCYAGVSDVSRHTADDDESNIIFVPIAVYFDLYQLLCTSSPRLKLEVS